LKLRYYQEKAITEIGNAFREGHKRVLLYLPTGAGKTEIAIDAISKILKSKQTAVFLTRGINLLKQSASRFDEVSSWGYIQGSASKEEFYNLMFVSIDTLISRKENKEIFKKLNTYDFIFVDECHDATSENYKKLLVETFKDKKIIGMTATPFEVNKKAHTIWQKVVHPISARELVEMGYLCPLRYFIPPTEIIVKHLVKSNTGDYTGKSMFKAVSNNQIYASYEDWFKKEGLGKKSCTFCVSIEHAEKIKSLLDKIEGANPIIVHSQLKEGKGILAKLKNMKKPFALISVNMVNRGIDIPQLEVGFMLRPTMSLVLWYQQLGRLMRIFENKHYATIIDFTQNFFMHRDPQSVDLEPDLIQKKKLKTKIYFKICPDCYMVCPLHSRECSSCGFDFSKSDRRNKRELEFIEGVELEEIRQEDLEMRSMFNQLKRKYKTYRASMIIFDKYKEKAFTLNGFSQRFKQIKENEKAIDFSGF